MKTNLKLYFKFLSRNKLYTIVSVLGFSIALMFVILMGVYSAKEQSYDNFHEHKDRIYQIASNEYSNTMPAVGPFLQEKLPEIEKMTRLTTVEGRHLVAGDKRVDKQKGYFVDSTFLHIFTFPLIEGDKATALSTGESVLLSRTLAIRLFGDESAVGKSLVINDVHFLVTGVLADFPTNTIFPQPDFVISMEAGGRLFDPKRFYNEGNINSTLFFLTRPNTDLPSRGAEVLDMLKVRFFIYNLDMVFFKETRFVPIRSSYFEIKYTVIEAKASGGSKTLMQIYGVIALLILVVAILNYVNMTVAQSGFRGKEAAIKRLLGSDRKSLVMQQFSESFIMVIITFALAILLAFAVEPYFNNILHTKINLSSFITPTTLLLVIPFLLILTTISAVVPASVITRFSPLEVVRGTFKRKVKSSYSKILIVFQYAVSMVLLISGWFIYQQVDFLLHGDKGFQPSSIYVLDYVADGTSDVSLRNNLKQIAGVKQVSFSTSVPCARTGITINISLARD